MTVYATPGEPKGGSSIAQNTVFVAYFTYASDGADNPYGDDYPMKVQERYRLVGAGTWTTLAEQTPSGLSNPHWSSYPGLAAGNYERQVRAQSTNSTAWSAFSASAFFTVTAVPAAPTMTAPAAGATITANTTTVSWSAPAGTTAYEVQVRTGTNGGGTLEWTSGQVTSNAQTMTASLLNGNNVTRYVRVRVRKDGLWSNWSQRQITVNYTYPQTPVFTTPPHSTDYAGLGMRHVVEANYSHPAPGGGQPSVNSVRVHARPAGDTSDGVELLAPSSLVGMTFFRWYVPRAGDWEFKVTAVAADGRESSTAWTTGLAEDVQIKGVVLLDPADPASSVYSFRLNDDGAEDDVSLESALVPVQGRTYPLLEYGVGEQRALTVGVLHSKGAADAAALLAFMRRRTVLCYRDSRGRKAYGRLEVGPIKDTFYGHVTSLTITATDFADDPDVA